MPHVVEAIYEDGMLKLDRPLPLKEREKVRVTVERTTAGVSDALEAVRRTYGMVRFSGGAEALETMAVAPEFDISESP